MELEGFEESYINGSEDSMTPEQRQMDDFLTGLARGILAEFIRWREDSGGRNDSINISLIMTNSESRQGVYATSIVQHKAQITVLQGVLEGLKLNQ